MNMSTSRPARRQTHLSDQDLLEAVRAGDAEAYGELFARHRATAARYARRFARRPADEDLVSAAHLAVLEAIRGGRGPAPGAFRPYLFAAIRSAAAREARRETTLRASGISDDLSALEGVPPFEDPLLTRLDTTLITRAYASLGSGYQTVLWHTAVEQQRPRAVAAVLGCTPRQAAGLAFRARKELARRFLQLHAADAIDERCRFTVERLSAWVRGALGERDRAVVARHLDDCRRCRCLAAELTDVNRSLRAAVWPLLFAVPSVGRSALGMRRLRRRRVSRNSAPGLSAAAAGAAALAIAVGLAGAITATGFSREAGAMRASSTSSAAVPTRASAPTPARATPTSAIATTAVATTSIATTSIATTTAPRTTTPRTTPPATTAAPATTTAPSAPVQSSRTPACLHGRKIGQPDCQH